MSFPAFTRLDLLASTPVSQTWRVAVGEGTAILREDRLGARLLGLDRAAEPGVIRAAAAAGIGPALIAADAAQGRLLVQWLPGRTWQAADFADDSRLHQVAQLLRRLHATPLDSPRMDLDRAIDRYARATRDAGSSAPPLVAAAREALLACEPLPPQSWRFCHNDPTPGNFIAGPDGALHLIDWEYAGLCDPSFDLAGVAAGAGLADEQSRFLLASYLGRAPDAAELARHRSWQVFCRALAALWQGVIDIPPATG